MTTMTTRLRPQSSTRRACPNNSDSLQTGDRLTQAEFHRRYELTPEHVRAELIRGIVYMASPVRATHGDPVARVTTALGYYESATPGVRASTDTTVILGDESEPQPDSHLRLLPECGGRTRTNAKGYLVGAPELVIEVAHSSEAIDLHAKRLDYADARVLEYLVLCVREGTLRAFDMATDKPLPVGDDGVFRSSVFPGLWIDPAAVLAGDTPRLFEVLRQGLATPQHAAFVQKLVAKRVARAKKPSRRGARRKS